MSVESSGTARSFGLGAAFALADLLVADFGAIFTRLLRRWVNTAERLATK